MTPHPHGAITRVLLTADPIGGVWTYALDLAAACSARGIDVVLATMGGPLSDTQRAAAARLARVALHERPCKLEWMDDPWDDVDAAGDWLLDLERRMRPDVVHLSSMCHGALPWMAPSIVVAHSCVLTWWRAVRGEDPPASLEAYRQRVGAGLRAADLVIAPTAAMLDALERCYGALPRACVVWNARDAAGFGAAHKEPFVLGAGRVWDEAKNLTTLDAAASDVRWPVRIAGERTAPHGATVSLRTAEWLGVLTPAQLQAQLAAASIYALPARYEPFGLSPVEAALSGCALVLGDIPSLREIWRDTALYVPPDDVHALAAAVNWLIDHPARRIRLAARARARAEARTIDAMALDYLECYRLARAAKVA